MVDININNFVHAFDIGFLLMNTALFAPCVTSGVGWKTAGMERILPVQRSSHKTSNTSTGRR